MERPDPDRRAVNVATLAAAFLVAQQVGGKATRDSLFLSTFTDDALPQVMVVSALASIVVVVLLSGLFTRVAPSRLVPAALGLSAALFVAEWFLNLHYPAIAAWAVYIHMGTLGMLVFSGFWSVLSERFDPHMMKLSIGRINGGSTFGGVVGGLAAERVGAMLDVPTMLLVLAGLNAAAAAIVLRIGAGEERRRTILPAPEPRSGLGLVARSPYLRSMGALVALIAIGAAFLDFAFKTSAARDHPGDAQALHSFFAIFYTVVSIATFAVQTLLSRPSLSRVGLGGTLAVLPLAVLGAGVLGAAVTRLWTITLLRGAEFAISNSLFRSGYELLYTPLAPDKKRPTKAIIDVGFGRVGDAIGSGLVWLLRLLPGSGITWVVAAAIGASLGALFCVLRLSRGYVNELAKGLQAGAVNLQESEIVDATTRRTLAETTMALDREKLLKEIAKLRKRAERKWTGEGTVVTQSEPPPGVSLDRISLASADEVVDLIRDLVSEEPIRIRGVLKRRPLERRLVPHVIPLLSHPGVGREALRALRSTGERAIGQLVDALLDPEQPSVVRRRIPRVLERCTDRRAADGLFRGLADRRFEVRFQCGLALLTLSRRIPDLRFPADEVFAAARRELDAGARTLARRRENRDEGLPDAAFIDGVLRRRMNRNLELAFAILGLALDREHIRYSLAALKSDDRNLRGTALEYLDNVLPDVVRRSLKPFIGEDVRVEGPRRSREEIVDEMIRTLDTLTVDRDSLKKL